MAVVSPRVAMSTGQEAVTPQKPPGGGTVAPSPATLSPVSECGFLTTIKAQGVYGQMSIGLGIRRRRLTLHGRMGLRTPVDSTFS